MELVFFVLGIMILIFYLTYLFIQDQDRYPSQSLNLLTLELSESRASEKRLQEELDILQDRIQQTFNDPVTNLLGWQLFLDRLTQSIKESSRNQLSFSIVYVDLDNFKTVNNALGYEMGDLLLKAVAERLQTCIRQVDSASRSSKDIFVLLLKQLNKPETTAVITQRILQALTQPFQIKEQELYLTVNIGVSVYPEDGEDAMTLLSNAERALFSAKEKGGNGCQFYQKKIQIGSQRELALHIHLNRESFFQELRLYFQPIVNVLDNSIFCMDILLYWQHPEFGLIGSQELFDYATKQRKLNTISEWILHYAVQQFIHWRSLGFTPGCLGMSITINQLENSHFIYSISQILQNLQYKPEWLLLKIVGNFTQVSTDVLEKSFNMLSYLNIKIAIENFDSSTFSLRQLGMFPIHYLTVSQLFIEDVHTNPQTAAFIKVIISLAHILSMQVIVQGVEFEQQLQALKASGCTLMQGQLLSDPLPESDVITKMAVTTV
ncbi:MAG TPA: EAL domain-containing protein [Gammaproteobacteria bacterium]|nr:EAL domain-containing protein [Gammaproteobacteria bacterium]